MSIKVKAVERKLKFEAGENGAFQYRYVLQPELYNKLSQSKVIQEASLSSICRLDKQYYISLSCLIG